jgi:hypothetical protein
MLSHKVLDGADLVVTTLDDIDLAALSDGRLANKDN